MRLLLLDQFSDPGGAQQGLLELLPAIRERGWKALVALPGAGELFPRIRALGFDVARVECGPYKSGSKSPMDAARFLTGTPKLARQIRGIAEGIGADVVYINGPRLLPGAAMAGLRAPALFHSHSYLFPGMVRRLAGISLRRLDAWVVGSCRFVAEPWQAFVRPERVSVIYNGVAGPMARAGKGQAKACPTIGCIGRIAPEKGQREFLVAASLIHRALPGCRFSIYGAPLFSDAGANRYDAEVHAAAEGLPVEFQGWVTDVYTALAGLDLVLVPSASHEATTRVILEAFAAGVPVIAFRSGGIPEVVEDRRTGWLAGSAEEMARLAIELLTGDPARLAAVAQAARESCARNFTLERWCRQVLEAMERAASPTASGTALPPSPPAPRPQ
jgi:glycosyltransferase involved in cell wall biosynthesis